MSDIPSVRGAKPMDFYQLNGIIDDRGRVGQKTTSKRQLER